MKQLASPRHGRGPRVIPAQAGIQEKQLDSRFRGNDIQRGPRVIPAQAGIQGKNNWIPTFVGMTPRLLHSAKIFPLFHFLFQMDYGWGIYGRGKICFIPTG